MILSTLIIAVSLVLFVYWFRYSCVLILNTRTTTDYSAQVAAENQLSFAELQGMLESSAATELVQLRESIERDFAVVDGMLAKATGLEEGSDAIENAMLRVDFRIMSAWFSLSRRFSDSGARTALDEMSQIVAHFANTYGERAAGSSNA
jgi:hypothetical protein